MEILDYDDYNKTCEEEDESQKETFYLNLSGKLYNNLLLAKELDIPTINILKKNNNIDHIIELIIKKISEDIISYINQIAKQVERGDKKITLNFSQSKISSTLLQKKTIRFDDFGKNLQEAIFSREEKKLLENLRNKIENRIRSAEALDDYLEENGNLKKDSKGKHYFFETYGKKYQYYTKNAKTCNSIYLICSDTKCEGRGIYHIKTHNFILKKMHNKPHEEHTYYKSIPF